MHRLHEDDLTGHVLAQEEWEIVRRPAVTEEEENLRGLVHRYLILWCAFPCTASIGSSKNDRARVGVRVALPRAAHAGRRDRQTSMKHRLKPLEAKAAQVPLPFVAQLNGCWCHRSQR